MRISKEFQLKSSIFLILLLISPLYCLGYAPPSDNPYSQQKISNQVEIFFANEYKDYSSLLHKNTLSIKNKLDEVFSLPHYYRKYDVIFLSSKNQIPLSAARVLPTPVATIFTHPVSYMDSLSIFDPVFQSLLIHEMTHLHQLSFQTKVSYLSSYFFPSLFWFVYPNIYMSSFVMEGHAVLMESIYGAGGRLFSGSARALVFAQLKSGYNLRKSINRHNNFFSSGLEKYLQGAYFFSYLHSRYPLKKINKLFYNNSKNFLFPIGIYALNRSFKKTFNKNYTTLFKEYKEHYSFLAEQQQSSQNKVLFRSQDSFYLNSDEKNLYLLISDLKSPPQLVILNKKTQNLSFKKVDMPLGKVFLINEVFYSAGLGQTSTLEKKFSLFKHGYKPLKKYNSHYVMDISQNKVLSVNVEKSFQQIGLFVNNKFYDVISSSAILDNKENIYYFKKNKNKRTLFKNKTPVFSYNAYYGFPVEADEQGIYFIAPTKYGSSLFMYSDNQVWRVSNSDTITTARKINSNEFLVSEVTNKDYEYKIIQTIKRKERPYLYKYSFQKEEILAKNSQSLQTLSVKEMENPQNKITKILQKESNKPLGPIKDLPSAGINLLEKNANTSHILNIKSSKEIDNPSHSLEKEKSKLQKQILESKSLGLNLETNRIKYKNFDNVQSENPMAGQKRYHKQKSHLIPQNIAPVKDYNYLTNWRLGDMLFNIYLSPEFKNDNQHTKSLTFLNSWKYSLSNKLKFIDSLGYNSINIHAGISKTKNTAEIYYSNRKYRAGFDIMPIRYERIFLSTKKNKAIFETLKNLHFLDEEDFILQNNLDKASKPNKKDSIVYQSQSSSFKIQYPIYKTQNWGISILKRLEWGQKKFDSKDWISYINHRGSAKFYYAKTYPFAYSSYSQVSVSGFYDFTHVKVDSNAYKSYLMGGISAYANQEVFSDFYLSIKALLQRELTGRQPKQIFKNSDPGITINFHSFRQTVQNLNLIDVKIKKAFNTPIYPILIPLALSRLAPLAGFSVASFNDRKNSLVEDRYLLSLYVGSELEMKANHMANFKLGIFMSYIWGWKNQFDINKIQTHFGVYSKVVF